MPHAPKLAATDAAAPRHAGLSAPWQRLRNRWWPELEADDRGRLRNLVFAGAGLCLAVSALIWLGWVATREWRRQTTALLERQETEALALTSEALARDMKGVWSTVLAPVNQVALDEDPPYDLLQLTAKAFARFPYPESFLVWKTDNGRETTLAFNRADRPPQWDRDSGASFGPFPAVLRRNPPNLDHVIALLKATPPSRSFALVNVQIDGTPYQVVAQALFAPTPPHRVSAIFAFTVNLNWVRSEYFEPIIQQLARIGGTNTAVALAVEDESGRVVARSGGAPADGPALRRHFFLAFFEPTLMAPQAVRNLSGWTLRVQPAANNPLFSVQNATISAFALIVLSAVASVVAILFTARAVRAHAVVASMKSDFVAAVTHELKTPVALVRLVGETLARGRYSSPDTVKDYARLLSESAVRLSHSIDGLLTYSRYTGDWRQPSQQSIVDVGEVVEDALEDFRPLLSTLGFEVTVDVPHMMPRVSADRRALMQVFSSIIDNAIKYSSASRTLRIVGTFTHSAVQVTFVDRGEGIAEDDIPHVFERFYRGQNARQGGTGLGLTIARRIIDVHHGTIVIRSSVDLGTEVELTMPIAS